MARRFQREVHQQVRSDAHDGTNEVHSIPRRSPAAQLLSLRSQHEVHEQVRYETDDRINKTCSIPCCLSDFPLPRQGAVHDGRKVRYQIDARMQLSSACQLKRFDSDDRDTGVTASLYEQTGGVQRQIDLALGEMRDAPEFIDN